MRVALCHDLLRFSPCSVDLYFSVIVARSSWVAGGGEEGRDRPSGRSFLPSLPPFFVYVSLYLTVSTQRERHRERDTERGIERDTERETQRETDTERHRKRHRERHRDTERHRERLQDEWHSNGTH